MRGAPEYVLQHVDEQAALNAARETSAVEEMRRAMDAVNAAYARLAEAERALEPVSREFRDLDPDRASYWMDVDRLLPGLRAAQARVREARDEVTRADAQLADWNAVVRAQPRRPAVTEAGRRADVLLRELEGLGEGRGRLNAVRAVSDEEALASVKQDPWYGASWAKKYEPEVASAARRALAVGAQPPLDYKGIGMTGVVFCDKRGVGYKAARSPETAIGRMFIEDEANYLAVASQVPGAQEHVARFRAYHPEEVVLERECAPSKDDTRRYRSGEDSKKFDTYRAINRAMEPYGFGAPEYKDDSLRWWPGRGYVLVDASMAPIIGARLVAHAIQVLQGKRFTNERPTDVAHSLIMEGGRTVDAARAERLAERLRALPDAYEYPLGPMGEKS